MSTNFEELIKTWSILNIYQVAKFIEEQTDFIEFWQHLFSIQHDNENLKSQFNQSYDFYHDCIYRHISFKRTAFTFIKESGEENWSYSQIHQIVNAYVDICSQKGIKKSDVVMITPSKGIEFIIALFTALRMGLKFQFLPFQSDHIGFENCLQIIKTIKPKAVFTSSFDSSLIPEKILKIVIEPDHKKEQTEFKSHAYDPEEIIQSSLALYRLEPLQTLPLDAKTMFLSALRDSALIFELNPGSSICYPLQDSLLIDPSFTLMCFLAGANLVHIDSKYLYSNPLALVHKKIQNLGLCEKSIELWLKKPGFPKSGLKNLSLNLLEITSSKLDLFFREYETEKIPFFYAILDNSKAGVILFSKKSTSKSDLNLLPTIGYSHYLQAQQGIKEIGSLQVNQGIEKNDQSILNLELIKIDGLYMLHQTSFPAINGICYPIEEVEKALHQLEFINKAITLPILQIGKIVSNSFELLIFIDPELELLLQDKKDEWNTQIKCQLTRWVGDAFQARSIFYYPLVPKKKGNFIDREWCNEQHRSRWLEKKSVMNVYKQLSLLKTLCNY